MKFVIGEIGIIGFFEENFGVFGVKLGQSLPDWIVGLQLRLQDL